MYIFDFKALEDSMYPRMGSCRRAGFYITNLGSSQRFESWKIIVYDEVSKLWKQV